MSVKRYKSELENSWKRICEHLDTENLPHPYNFHDLLEEVNEIEEIHGKLKILELDKNWIMKQYLNEIWLSEIPPPTGTNIDTCLLVDYVMDNQKDTFLKEITEMANGYPPNPEKWWCIMYNLWSSMMKVFDEEPVSLTEEGLCRLHAQLMNNLIENGGSYRKRDVSAFGSSVAYLPHQFIGGRVPILLNFITDEFNKLSDVENKTLKALCLGGFFFSEYLLIHPFIDGNGRVSRLALSILLKDYTIVPVSLYYKGDRKLYIKALEERGSGMKIPWSVIQYVIDSCLDNAQKVYHNFQKSDE